MVMNFKEENKLRLWKFFTRLPRFRSSDFQIGHFRVAQGLCSKERLSAKPLIWIWLFIFKQMKFISTRKVLHLASFWKLEFGTRKMAYCSGLAQLSTKKQHLIIDCFVAYLYLTIYILLYRRYHTYFLQLFCSNFVNVVKFVHRLNIWMLSFMRLKYHLYVRHVAIFADTYQTYLVFSVILLGHLSKTWVTKVTLFVRLSCLLSWI